MSYEGLPRDGAGNPILAVGHPPHRAVTQPAPPATPSPRARVLWLSKWLALYVGVAALLWWFPIDVPGDWLPAGPVALVWPLVAWVAIVGLGIMYLGTMGILTGTLAIGSLLCGHSMTAVSKKYGTWAPWVWPGAAAFIVFGLTLVFLPKPVLVAIAIAGVGIICYLYGRSRA